MISSKFSSALVVGIALTGCGKFEQAPAGIEGIVSKKGQKVFQIITSNGHPLCVKGIEDFEPNTDVISQHPKNDDLYEVTEQLKNIDPKQNTINPNSKISVTKSGNDTYFIVRQDGVEIMKLYVTKGRDFTVDAILSADELEKKLKECNEFNP